MCAKVSVDSLLAPKKGNLTSLFWACVKIIVDMLLAHFGLKKVKNPDGVCKSIRRYVAGTKNGHLTGSFLACVKMTIDMLLAKKGHLIGPFWAWVQKGKKSG